MDDRIDTLARKIWDYMLLHHEMRKMDCIFALGSNHTRVASRAAELYRQEFGDYIICAGGFGKDTKYLKSEAEVFAEIIISEGVPQDKVLIEPNSTNTGENILFVKKLLAERNLNPQSFILVQKPYMERRTFATFSKQWEGKECLLTSPKISYEEYGKDTVFKKLYIAVMVGDLLRIREYPKLGFQVEQHIPEDVWDAGQELLKLGFNKYDLK